VGSPPSKVATTAARRITQVLTEVRNQLEVIKDVDGVLELLDRLPECVLVGGIAARRELVAALLGESGVANSAAALLAAPGMRQPLALELRVSDLDVMAYQGEKAEQWLKELEQCCAPALGNKLRVDPLRLRLYAAGCACLDVVDLPERSSPQGGVPTKIEEMRVRHMGSSGNLLVCLEPGTPLELCYRFDPAQKRTVLIGAASAAASGEESQDLPSTTLCGAAAASALEERFAGLCFDRVPQWLAGLEKLERRLTTSTAEARELEHREAPEEVLRRARSAGVSFGRALQHVVQGAPGCQAGALTLEEELLEFAGAAGKGQGGISSALSASDAAAAAADLFATFDGVEGYAAYLRNDVGVPGADVPLNGGAAWKRLLEEVEVAMRLAHPPPEELAGLMLGAIRAGGTSVHGHQRWEDVSSKLMLSIAYEPLRRRIRYVAARVGWVLKHQKAAVSEWMSTLSDGPTARLYSPLFSQHLELLRKQPIVRDLVFGAYNEAAEAVGAQLLKNLEGTLTAGCISPELMLRPSTEPSLDPAKEVSAPAGLAAPSESPKAATPKAKSGRATEARKRVASEMRLRSGPSGGLPVQLRDRVFEPSEAQRTLPFVEVQLRHSFSVLADTLANQAFAFADTSMTSLCRRQVDEAMNKIEFSSDQYRALAGRHSEMRDNADQVEKRLDSIRICVRALRTADRR
jgi:hypothetical protein